MSLFSNVNSAPADRHSLPSAEPAAVVSAIRPSMTMYFAAIMILMLVLLSVSIIAVHLRPSPANPDRDFGDRHNPPKFVEILPDAVSPVHSGIDGSAPWEGGGEYDTVL